MSVKETVGETIDRLGAQDEKGEGKPSPSSRSGGGNNWSDAQRRAQSERMKARWADGTAPRNPRKSSKRRPEPERGQEIRTPPSDAEIAAYGVLGGVIWKLAGRMAGLRPLNPEEQAEFGSALAGVGHKYAPFLDRWAEEVTLGITIIALVEATKLPRGETPAPEEPANKETMQ